MNATSLAPSAQPEAGAIVGLDLAKNVFQLCVANAAWRPRESQRLSRSQFERWFANRAVSRVIMEACGSAHHWARWLTGLGIQVTLLPARYVRAYVRRNKTDAADAAALLEAARCADLHPVRVKSVEQQALQALHRTRSLWQADRTRRINTLRGYCREFGIAIALGSRLGLEQITRVLAEPRSGIPELLHPTMVLLVEEVRLLEARIAALERQLAALVRHSPACTTLLSRCNRLDRCITERTKHCIDAGLVAGTLRLEPFEDVLIDPDRDGSLGRKRLQPTAHNTTHDVANVCFRVLRRRCRGLCARLQTRPVSLGFGRSRFQLHGSWLCGTR